MKTQRLLMLLTLINLGFLVFLVFELLPAVASGTLPVLRGRGLQIVDDRGKVRASIEVLPASVQSNGERSAETVLLRLITERGRPSIKIGASEQEAGISLVGPTNTKDTYIQMGAKGTTSALRVRNEDGKEVVVKP
jgi:hypothetical protein